MNNKNERRQYVSNVLLERFRIPASRLQCFQVEAGQWEPKSIDRACSAKGYNQLLLPGGVDNRLEANLQKVETGLPGILKALDAAVNAPSTTLAARKGAMNEG